MKSYPLISSLAEVQSEKRSAVAFRLWDWLKRNCHPAAPSKPIDQMTEKEFDRLNLF